MRRSRKRPRVAVNEILALGGVSIILLQAAFITDSRADVSLILLGIIINQIGVWRLASHILPPKRVYMALRGEVDDFVALVRKLNTQVVDGSGVGIDNTRRQMIEAIDRICDAAGVVGYRAEAGAARSKMPPQKPNYRALPPKRVRPKPSAPSETPRIGILSIHVASRRVARVETRSDTFPAHHPRNTPSTLGAHRA